MSTSIRRTLREMTRTANSSRKLSRRAKPPVDYSQFEVINPSYVSVFGVKGVKLKGPDWTFGFEDIKREFKANFDTFMQEYEKHAIARGREVDREVFYGPDAIDDFELEPASGGYLDIRLRGIYNYRGGAYITGLPQALNFPYRIELFTPEEFDFYLKNASIDHKFFKVVCKSGNILMGMI